MHVLGDVYDIASRVRAYDPSYELSWNPEMKQYQVLTNKRVLRKEGALNGRSFCSMQDHKEIIFTWEIKGMAPDMRIIWQLQETDVWRYPGGPKAFYRDMIEDSAKRKQKNEDHVNDEVEYVAGEYHPLVFEKKKSYTGKAG